MAGFDDHDWYIWTSWDGCTTSHFCTLRYHAFSNSVQYVCQQTLGHPMGLIFVFLVFTARKRSLRRLCFYRCLSVHRGGGGMRGCSWGGMHGCSGGCVWLLWGEHAWLLLGGHAWLLPGSMHGCSGGRAWFFR